MKLLTNSKTTIDELKKIHIERSEDLINHLPYRYDSFDYSDESELIDNQRVVIYGRLVSNPRHNATSKYDLITFHFITLKGSFFTCVIFNRPYIMKILDLDSYFTIVGTLNLSKKEINVISIKKGEIPKTESLKPVYHLPNGITQSAFTSLVKRTFEALEQYNGNTIPSYLNQKYRLENHNSALKMVHMPSNNQEISKGLRTLKFEECLEYCFKNRIIREQNRKIHKNVDVEIDTQLVNKFILDLSYKLTKDQISAIRDIVLDMKDQKVMYRLLQGDVGTGKTIVGIVALYANYLRKKQGAFLAPTDSLARQHYANVKNALEKYGIKVSLLVGDMSLKDKNIIKKGLENNEIDIIVGTHAIFSESVVYHNLSLALIDEQHRFGVNQRNILANKGEDVDLLLMSATPIPRTLALSIYGDLDVSSLEEYPIKERKVITKVVDYSSEKILSLIHYCVDCDKQVFIVCPKISYGGKQESSEDVYERFKPVFEEKIGILHGKMSNKDKIEILEKFKTGEIKVLVSTTIVELGIDIANATGIIIYSANSFGLASLHQLRGRVGRDGSTAYCLLVDDIEEDISRLKFLETCSNGFEISEEDMKRRGPGDFIGVDQSGFPSFNSLNIVSDFKMFTIARDEVEYMFRNLNDPEICKYYNYCLNKLQNDENISLID